MLGGEESNHCSPHVARRQTGLLHTRISQLHHEDEVACSLLSGCLPYKASSLWLSADDEVVFYQFFNLCFILRYHHVNIPQQVAGCSLSTQKGVYFPFTILSYFFLEEESKCPWPPRVFYRMERTLLISSTKKLSDFFHNMT